MQSIYKLVIIPILSLLIGLFGPLFPPCEGCDSKVTLPCDGCGGDGFNYNVEFDVDVVCSDCGGSGEVNCTVCSDLAQVYYGFVKEVENSK